MASHTELAAPRYYGEGGNTLGRIMKPKKRTLIISLIVAVALILGAAGAVFFVKYYNATPSLSLRGSAVMTLEVGTSKAFSDPGARASCNGKDLSDKIARTGSVDTSRVAAYTLTYQVSNLFSRNPVSVRRTVKVVDTQKPVITLKGAAAIALYTDDPYKDPGFNASDNYDGDLTEQVVVTQHVDTTKAGAYEVLYTVADSSENTATAKRTVTIRVRPLPTTPPGPNEKIVYLTFDDGPSTITPRILEILAQQNVKATWFVMGRSANAYPYLKNIAAAGHAIGLHTFTHDYRQIYASDTAFFSDIGQVAALVKQQTGIDSHILRFAGGSSNSSSKFNPGIMTKLAQEVTAKGYVYFDWDVTSDDATVPQITRQQYVDNVIKGISKHKQPIVLMHDMKKNADLVEGLPQIIEYARAQGYRFEVLTTSTPPVHHHINN